MKYRKFGKIDFEASILGFGCMRFPLAGDNPIPSDIDDDQAIKMIRYAIDNGVNYMDTAYVYHSGRSETVLGKALKNGYRGKVKIATKCPTFRIDAEEDFDRILDEQLKRLGTDHIDFYLMHALGQHSWDNVVMKFGLMEKAERAKEAGKIGHIGFSFHDKHEAFINIIDAYDKWEFCQIQLNYLNEEYQAGLEGLRYAADKGLGVVIMEPLLGGKLAKPAKKIIDRLDETDSGRTPAQWALDYLWNLPEVSLILSGMSNMEQLQDNVLYADKADAGMFTEQDTQTIAAVQGMFKEIEAVPCTKCSYCMPCPSGVDIPRNFEIYNDVFLYENLERSHEDYDNFRKETKGKKTADNCIKCQACESLCPQGIAISKEMERVEEKLGEGR